MVTRRSLMLAGAASVAQLSMGVNLNHAASAEPIRYPDPSIKVLDPRFQGLILGNAAVERIATGCRFTEGPVWFGDGRYLLWSDIPNDRIMRWEEETGAVSVFRKPSNYSNGNTRDRQGRLVTCEHDTQHLTRTEYDGAITILADSFEGKPLTGPNDVVVKSDNSIWFSDNGAGTRGNYLGHTVKQELPFRVYRLDPATGQTTIAVGDMKRPNGLAFSPDEKLLYVVDTPGPGQRTVQVYDVVDNGTKTANRREFCAAEPGGSDGLRVDVHGNVWCAWSGGEAEDGVAVFAPDGKMIGRIMLPERCANVCFGGRKRNRLFMAASQSVYSLYVETQGAIGG
ncbi:MAG TPA: SMP-30/gluconolactonase/LRE family protein [Stellaceae bacterium]|nr:SMP-30/gluconolactonase/LRE family protein [Stellaceae bacterium]